MRIHHLNLATLEPFASPKMTCHALLLDFNGRLMLIDTGLGTADLKDPKAHLSALFRLSVRPRLDMAETAVAQIQALGHKPDAVSDILMTHLDIDHAGGLPDFPQARVHVLDRELDAAQNPRNAMERSRYGTLHFSDDTQWAVHMLSGETWFDFKCTAPLPGLPTEMRLIFLSGHTRGHCGVVVRREAGIPQWILHAGDAYTVKSEMDLERPHCPAGIKMFQAMIASDNELRLANQVRLRRLKKELGENLTMFCTHDFDEFAALRWPVARQ